MSSGPDNVTSTTTSTPPDFLIPSLTGAANAAHSQFNRSGGNQLVNQSQELIGQTLNGDFLNSNPHLDKTFNRAADLTRTRLSSEFAGNGRDISASAPARSEELQTLAANIYGGNFQAERDRQMGALGQAQGFDPLNRFINQLGGIIPGAGGVTSSAQPVFRQGLF